MKTWMSGLCLAVALGLATAAAADAVTDAGVVRGVREGGLIVYKGVPFAAAPLGELRWREPAPVAPWRGVRAARDFAPACMQAGVSMPGEIPPKTSEDCLYLNVWAPARGRAERLPVLVWIYRGGFTNGSGSMPLYWGDQLARRGKLRSTVAEALACEGPAIIDAIVVADELPNVPHIDLAQIGKVAQAKVKEAVLAVTGG